jgi:hypothetical protein
MEPLHELINNMIIAWPMTETLGEDDTQFKRYIQEKILSQLLTHYLHGININVQGYFSALPSVVNRRRVKAKSEIVAILFGDNVQEQNYEAVQKDGPPAYNFKINLDASRRALSLNLGDKSQYKKKKKRDKLEGFFGNKLPKMVLEEQKLVKEEKLRPPPPTESPGPPEPLPRRFTSLNELTLREKKALTKRTRKLQEKFGRALDENAINTIVSVNFIPDTGRVLSTISGDTTKLSSVGSRGSIMTQEVSQAAESNSLTDIHASMCAAMYLLLPASINTV